MAKRVRRSGDGENRGIITRTVAGTYLRSGVTVRGPSEGPLGVRVEQSVLLLNAKPRVGVLGLVHHLVARESRVRGQGLHVHDVSALVDLGLLVDIAHDENVVPASEGILEEGSSRKNRIRRKLAKFSSYLERIRGRARPRSLPCRWPGVSAGLPSRNRGPARSRTRRNSRLGAARGRLARSRGSCPCFSCPSRRLRSRRTRPGSCRRPPFCRTLDNVVLVFKTRHWHGALSLRRGKSEGFFPAGSGGDLDRRKACSREMPVRLRWRCGQLSALCGRCCAARLLGSLSRIAKVHRKKVGRSFALAPQVYPWKVKSSGSKAKGTHVILTDGQRHVNRT